MLFKSLGCLSWYGSPCISKLRVWLVSGLEAYPLTSLVGSGGGKACCVQGWAVDQDVKEERKEPHPVYRWLWECEALLWLEQMLMVLVGRCGWTLPQDSCLQLPLTTECKQVGNLPFLSIRASPSNSRRTKLAGFLSVLLLPIGYWLSLMSLIDFTVRLLGNNRRSLSADSETQHGSGSYLESYLCNHKGWIFVVVLFCSN